MQTTRSRRKETAGSAALLIVGSVALGMTVVGVGGFWGVTLLVRHRIESLASRRGAEVTVDRVHLGLGTVTLEGFHLKSLDGHVAVDATTCRVPVSITGRPSGLILEGGQIHLTGETETLVDTFQSLRGKKGPTTDTREAAEDAEASDLAARSSLPIDVKDFALQWVSHAGEAPKASLEHMQFARTEGSTRVSVGQLVYKDPALQIEVSQGNVELAGRKLKNALAASAVVRWRAGALESTLTPKGPAPFPRPVAPGSSSSAGGASAHAPSGMASASSPEPAVLPALGSDPRRKSRSTKRYSGSRSPSGKDAHGKEVPGLSHETPGDAPTAAPPPPWLARILPRTLRERTVNLARLVAQSLAPEAKAHVDDLRVSLLSGGQGIELGPGTFDGGEDNGNFVATFATADHDGDAPLKAQLRIPLGEGALHASLSGGPVKLPILQKLSTSAPVGTKSARFSGNLDLSLDARLAVKGDVEVQGLSVDHPALASTPLEGLDLGVALDGVIEESGAIAVGASTLRVGKARIGLAGKYTPAEGLGQGDLRVDLAPISCDDLLYSVPSALLPLIQGAHLSGAFGAQAHIAFDQDALDKLVLDTHFSSQCEFVEVPAALARARLRSSFAHRIYLADGTMEDRITGPAEANWSPATWTSPYMQAAVLSSEDGGFFKHKGFSMGAFRGALIADLKAGRFVRGASTISMQLAKNLFLTREKTLSRKLEELLLTSYLEQVLTKDEMLETYFNVIEYGPDVYGIKEAAEHYFDSTPHELTVAQAFFLASILPSPARYHSMYEAGAIGAGWRKYLDRLMMNAEKVGLLSPEEARNGMAEILEFASNGKTVSTAKQPLGPQRGSRRPTRDLDQDTGHPGVDWSLGP